MSFRLFVVLFLFVSGLSSCYINKDFMFQTDSDFVFDTMMEDSTDAEFKIQPNTTLSIQVYTNDGALLLEYSTGGGEGRRFMGSTSLTYVVDSDGYVDLPVIGKQYLSGMTIREAQDFLSQLYEKRYNGTFVIVKAESRRVIVFNGNNSRAEVVKLNYNGISIIEAISMAGGISQYGMASKVKIMRKKDDKYEVYQIDLSKIEGIKYANTAVESGDIIYVQPIPRLGKEILSNIQPIVTIFSTVSVLILAMNRLF